MFYDIFNELCAKKKISKNKAIIDMGLSNSIATKWKKTGATPEGATLTKIAEYFDVSVDYLLGNEQKKEAPEREPDLRAYMDTLSDAELLQLLQDLTAELAERRKEK